MNVQYQPQMLALLVERCVSVCERKGSERKEITPESLKSMNACQIN